MPVSKSAKKALKVDIRRRAENLISKETYKKAVKAVRKAAQAGVKDAGKLMSEAQSALDMAAKKKAIHPNKAARLKSRLSKLAGSTSAAVSAAPKKAAAKKTSKKPTSKKTTKK